MIAHVSPLNALGDAEDRARIEEQIASKLVAFGAATPSDDNFDGLVAHLGEQAMALLPDGQSITRTWLERVIVETGAHHTDPMMRAALQAAAGRLSSEVAEIPRTAMRGDRIHSEHIRKRMKTLGIGMALDATSAAARASELTMLNRAEIEYRLGDDGINQFSILSVQPLYESGSLRHNAFLQGSYSYKDHRDTLNLGLGYRFMSPDKKHLFGASIFLDHEWPYHHSRLGIGADYKTSLMGVHLNHYRALSDWKARTDGFDEKALSGSDLMLSGRVPQAPNVELFLRGFHWNQDYTPVVNPSGEDIWGYEAFAEYTPVNALTLRAGVKQDNAIDDLEADVGVRFNYHIGEGTNALWDVPVYNLNTVADRRFDKVQRINEIRVQERQRPGVSAMVVFAQGANVSVGAVLPFGTTITTGGAAGDGVSVRFGNGAVLNIGLNSSVRVDADLITLTTGTLQFVSAEGGISNLAVAGSSIALLGTDVDLTTDGARTTLRVRDGAATFTDETGTTRVEEEEFAESRLDDGLPPQIRGSADPVAEAHAIQVHEQIHLSLPPTVVQKAVAYSDTETQITGTLAIGNPLTFTVPTTQAVTVTGPVQLLFRFGGADRLATYSSGSGTDRLVFSYTATGADAGLDGIEAQEIRKNGGTLTGANGLPMVLTLSGSFAGSIPNDTTPDAFSFTDQTDVALSTLTTSNTITVAGINTNAPISIAGDGSPEFRINGGAWTSAATTVSNGDTVELRLTSAASGGTTNSATLDIGGVTDQWDVTTISDTTPDAFSFTDQTGVAVSTLTTSNTITVAGINTNAPISIAGDGSPEFRINGGAWTSAATTVSNGDTVELRLTSAASGGTTNSATLDIGGVTDQWDVTTISDTTPDAFSFTDQTGVAVSTLTTSNTITVAGLNNPSAISIAGDGSPEFRINGGAWTSAATTVSNGNTVELRLTSAAAGGTTNSATLDIGGVTDQWDVTSETPTPDPFDFIDQTGVALSTIIESNIITVSGMSAPGAISINLFSNQRAYRINGGAWVTSEGIVSNGDTVQLRVESPPLGGSGRFIDVTIGTVTDRWTASTTFDDTPDAFSFTDQTDVAVSTLTTSNTITVAGLNNPSAISIAGDGSPEFRINGGAWTSVAGTVANGDTVELRLTSAASDGTTNSATLDIGGVTDQWDVTTFADCPNIGDVCADGSIHAGQSPDGNVAMYTTPADAPSLMPWNNGNASGYIDTTMINCTSATPGPQSSCQTGEANTGILVAEDSDSGVAGVQPHQAAAYCDGLTAHGHSDWYLPAQDELNVLYTNRVAIGGFNLSGSFPAGWYWSSSEATTNVTRGQRFSDGAQSGISGKDNGIAVRCVRR